MESVVIIFNYKMLGNISSFIQTSNDFFLTEKKKKKKKKKC